MDDYERPFRQTTRRARSTHNAKQPARKRGMLTAQVVACGIIIAAALLYKMVGAEEFEEVRVAYQYMMRQEISVGQVTDGLDQLSEEYGFLQDVSNMIKSVQAVFAPVDDMGASATSEDASSDTESAASSAGSIPEEPSATSSNPHDSAVSSVSGSAGGADLWGTWAVFAPDGATFAPCVPTAAVTPPLGSAVVTSVFGYREHPKTGEEGFHKGVDLAAAEGTAIRCALPGRVKKCGSDDKSGNYIVVSHAGETETLYAHCSELIAKEGETVGAGETIALVGSTGDTTGPHLHFEVHVGGIAYDPWWILSGADGLAL